ncbi:MAG: chorismate mutase [Bacilli bacterium]|nr:chorismate mutase [Bacilli bacterium]
MNKLEEARLIINKVDEQMRVLFEERMKASEMVAEYKKENNLPIFDEKREKEIISKQASLINPILKDEYLEFYTSLITISKKYQDKKING